MISAGDINSLSNLLVLCGVRREKTGQSGPEVIKHFSFSTQLSIKFILLINVKIPTICGMINTPPESFKGRKVFIFQQFL